MFGVASTVQKLKFTRNVTWFLNLKETGLTNYGISTEERNVENAQNVGFTLHGLSFEIGP